MHWWGISIGSIWAIYNAFSIISRTIIWILTLWTSSFGYTQVSQVISIFIRITSWRSQSTCHIDTFSPSFIRTSLHTLPISSEQSIISSWTFQNTMPRWSWMCIPKLPSIAVVNTFIKKFITKIKGFRTDLYTSIFSSCIILEIYVTIMILTNIITFSINMINPPINPLTTFYTGS